MGAPPPLLLPSAPVCCSCAAGLSVAGPRRLAATPSSPSSVASNSTLLLRPSCRLQGRASVARAARGGGEGEGGKSDEAAFFGEDGVVEDMDGYMDYLSLEYDSVWDTKPAWSVHLLLFLLRVSCTYLHYITLRHHRKLVVSGIAEPYK
jgi:hypothetical protein